MSERASDSRLIETKITLIMLVFGFLSGLHRAFSPYMGLYLNGIGFSPVETGVFSLIIGYVTFFISPVILFVILYFACGGNLLQKVASTAISIILGSVIGGWLGLISGALLLTFSRFPVTFAEVLYAFPLGRTWAFVDLIIVGFVAVAAAEINRRWREALSKQNLRLERPFGVVVISFLYAILGILVICLAPLLFSYSVLLEMVFQKPLIGIGLIIVLVFSGFIQVLIGVCLYLGKKWGWIPAFYLAVLGMLDSANLLLSFEKWSHSPLLSIVVVSLAVTNLIISVIIIAYLLQFNVRRYFGFINPAELEAQSPSTAS